MNEITQLLAAYDANTLKQIARENGIDAKNLSKDAAVKRLAEKWTRREEVAGALAQLKPVEREILAYIQRLGGEVAASALKRVLLKAQIIAPTPRPQKKVWSIAEQVYTGNANYSGTPALEDVAARLTRLGLVLSREVATSYRQMLSRDLGRYLVIPQEIRALLPEPPRLELEQARAPVRIAPGAARNFQRDLSRYWSFVRRSEKLELTSQGWLYKKTLTELLKMLGWREEKKADEKTNLQLFFLRRLLVALQLLEPAKDQGREEQRATVWYPSEGTDFWSRPPTERVQAAFAAWRDGTAWNELRVPAATYGCDHRRAAPAQLAPARRVVLEHLKRRGAAGWHALDALRDDIRLAHYEFLFPRSRSAAPSYGYGSNQYTPYYHGNNPYGITYKSVTSEEGGWDQIEAAIITHIVAGPLHWLGLTDVGFEQEGAAPSAYRLTALGAWLLGIGAPVTMAQEGGRVVVQPNFQIVAMEPIAEQVLMTLDEFAQFEGGDHALTYRLTRESVYRGQRADWDAARMIAYLEQATQAALPQNVRRSLEEWQALHERITLRRNVVLVQAEAAATLDELYAQPALAEKLGRRAAEAVALSRENVNALLGALHAAGCLPQITRAEQFDAPASLRADAEGNVELVGRVPSIYAYGAIEPFAEITDARRARVTPARVLDAAQNGVSVPAMLARLQSVHRGPVPPKLIQSIKAWGRYYGDARLGRLMLIEFRDEAARAELLNDPELKPHLARFDAGARPLALVREEALEQVKALLAERGVEIRGFE